MDLYSVNPFKRFDNIPEPQALLDYTFKRADGRGIAITKAVNMLEKIKRKEIGRINNVINILTDKIKGIIESIPNLEELPEFYRKLSNILVHNDELRLALGKLNGILPLLNRLETMFLKKIKVADNSNYCAQARIQFFGRVSSIIRKQKTTLEFLEQCRIKLKKVPTINLNMPSVVIAGYPNVGKSSLVGCISSSQPQVSYYPFTTKQIYIGMYVDSTNSHYFQVIDTPGILDRPMVDRNEIEKQAILALNTIASYILFVFDPTASSGYEIAHQVALYNEIKEVFLGGLSIPMKIVINKIDFATPEEINDLLKLINIPKEEMFMISAKEKSNIDPITKFLLAYFKANNFRR